MKTREFLSMLFVLGSLVFFGFMTGRFYEDWVRDKKEEAAKEKLKEDLAAPAGSVCPTYRQVESRRLCQSCLLDCYPMLNLDAPPGSEP